MNSLSAMLYRVAADRQQGFGIARPSPTPARVRTLSGGLVRHPTVVRPCKLYQVLERPYRTIQFANHRAGAALSENVQQFAVVPDGAVPRSVETAPQVLAEQTVVQKDCAGIVEFVSQRHPDHRRIGRLHVADVAHLSIEPGRLGENLRVRTALN